MEKYQTLKDRVIAILADVCIIAMALCVIVFVSGVFQPTPKMARIIIGVWGFLAASYFIVMHARRGQTFGKKAAGIKVLDESEQPINFGQAVLRSLPQLIPMMFAVSISTAGPTADRASLIRWSTIIFGLAGLFMIVDVVVCLLNEKRRALHDFFAGTIVVRTDV